LRFLCYYHTHTAALLGGIYQKGALFGHNGLSVARMAEILAWITG